MHGAIHTLYLHGACTEWINAVSKLKLGPSYKNKCALPSILIVLRTEWFVIHRSWKGQWITQSGHDQLVTIIVQSTAHSYLSEPFHLICKDVMVLICNAMNIWPNDRLKVILWPLEVKSCLGYCSAPNCHNLFRLIE